MTTTEPSRSKLVRCFVVAAAALFAACGPLKTFSDSAHAQTAPPAFPVTVATPLAKHIKTWDEYSGRFEAVARVELRPRVSGFVEQVNFKEGSDVKQGDLLFTLDKRPFEIASSRQRPRSPAPRRKSIREGRCRARRAARSIEGMSEQVFEQRKSTWVSPTPGYVRSRPVQVGRTQPRMGGSSCADIRPHLRQENRCRQPCARWSGQLDIDCDHRHDRPDPFRLRCFRSGLYSLRAPQRFGTVSVIACHG